MKHLMWLGIVLLAGCGSDEDPSSCGGRVDEVMAGGAPGTITISGDFADGQPIVQVSQGGGIMNFVAASNDDTSATFTGLPSSSEPLTVHWLLSCFDDSGQATMSGPGTVTVP